MTLASAGRKPDTAQPQGRRRSLGAVIYIDKTGYPYDVSLLNR